ncbi:CGNR zinc finger domain-containing protein [Herbidospora mongoliensis]|uniref:CGNR zinc finger domain-containing protein n=1 Tax=Herbidospora mongoliensis TaxID=688067 RepID=UPI00082DBB5B|nr:ABATE domain-containing protein [Herbidospora mongoliensis]
MEVELVGNAFCLDFTNTVNARPVARRDWLSTPEEALTWAAATGHPLQQIGDPAEDSAPETRDLRDLAAAREFRETVFRVFQPVAHGGSAPQEGLDRILAVYGEGVTQGHLSGQDGNFRLEWAPPRTVRVLMWEAATSAMELLTHGPLDRLGECPSCCWLFLDVSKNRRRRWCSMTTCGSRDKSRRYYSGKG